MLQKAVDIHFDLNYRHLCTSVAESSGVGSSSNKDTSKDDKAESSNKKAEVMQSSLIDETMQT